MLRRIDTECHEVSDGSYSQMCGRKSNVLMGHLIIITGLMIPAENVSFSPPESLTICSLNK